MGWNCLAYKSYWLRDHFLLVLRSDHTTGSRNIKPEVAKVHKMAWNALFYPVMGPFKGRSAFFVRLWPIGVTVKVSFTTGAVWSAILPTARLLVLPVWCRLTRVVLDKIKEGHKMCVCVCVNNPRLPQNTKFSIL